MPSTNFHEWALHYDEILSRKYDEFCVFFDKGYEPDFMMFLKFVWDNTTKVVNPITGNIEARLT